MQQQQQQQQRPGHFGLECEVSANPLERVLWLRDGRPLEAATANYQIETGARPATDDPYSHVSTLTVGVSARFAWFFWLFGMSGLTRWHVFFSI